MTEFTAAAKMQLITELLETNIYDEDGNIIGQREPLISKEDALKLLNGGTVEILQKSPSRCIVLNEVN